LTRSIIVLTEYTYLYFFDEPSCCPLHSIRLLIDGDLFMADIVVSMFTVDVYVLSPILWLPLDFLDDVVIRLCRLLGTGLLSLSV
jgi:hypothetical protein